MVDEPTKPPSGNDAAFEGTIGYSGNEPTIIDPATLGGSSGGNDDGQYGDEYERDGNGNLVIGSSGKPRRKRGRKSGGSNRGSNGGSGGSTAKSSSRNSQTVNSGAETLSKTLLIVHMGLASYTKFEAMQLEQAESDALSSSIINVMEQFDWEPDPRFTAIAGLVTTAATIYGPRAYLYREHLKEQAAKRKQEKMPTNTEQFSSNIGGAIDMTQFGPGGLSG